ncbi:hypothetical protein SQ54_27225 [Klebsiella pneumoniae]|nr:hypothetical protein SQ54_27225 [Klebsiella pneumoniae]ODM37991.1 hypothetical protein ACT15_11490 [Klebsiella pneumoniae]
MLKVKIFGIFVLNGNLAHVQLVIWGYFPRRVSILQAWMMMMSLCLKELVLLYRLGMTNIRFYVVIILINMQMEMRKDSNKEDIS